MAEHTPAPTPARSLYGFFMFLFSKTALIVYFIWAFVPDFYLHYFNIYYYPDKYWATAIPIECLVALTLFAFLIYPSSNLILTCPIDNLNTIADPLSKNNIKVNKKVMPSNNICVCADEHKCKLLNSISPNTAENTVPQLQDLNIRFVCRKLYLNNM